MKTTALATVVALIALNVSAGLASGDAYDGRLAAGLSANTTSLASAARSDRAQSQAPDAMGEVARTGKRPLPDPRVIRLALGTDRI
ncbi:hypothetical protein ABID65_001127 [Bradyrhizobium sp. S3.9.2]